MLRPEARMNAVRTTQGIGRAVSVEAWRGPECAGEPGWRGRTGILDQACPLWMLEGSLCFAIVVKTKLIHRAVADRPSVGQVPLLETLLNRGSEPWHVCASSLELREWKDHAVVIKIIVSTEVLFVVDAMINLDRELITPLRLPRRSLDGVSAGSGVGH